MAKIWGAVHWWEDWQLRILVLSSLGLQWFLLLAAPMRKYTIPRWFRTFIWLAYIGSDALAIYALATLFNRHARGSGGGDWPSRALEVLWAPILLIHLGGQEEITAYNIEDNELWTRHTVTLVSQVAVAVYAFCKSWRPGGSGDRRLLASAILLFVVGILSFSEKPWALRRASINRLAAVSSRVHGRSTDKSSTTRRWAPLFRVFSKLDDKYIHRWRRTPMRPHHHHHSKHDGDEDPAAVLLSDGDKVHMILSDMSLFAASSDLLKREVMRQDSVRSSEMRRQREEGKTEVQVHVQGHHVGADEQDQVLGHLSPSAEMGSKPWLRSAFNLIYTRINVATTPAYLAYHFLLVPAIHAAAIALFAASRKRGYNPTDVRITYIILLVTAALDVLAGPIRWLLFRLMSAAGVPALCETLPQYSLLSSVRRRMHPATGWLLKCAASLGLEEEFFVCCKRENLYRTVAGFVMLDLVRATSGRATGLDLATYRSFTGSNWALNQDLQRHCRHEIRRTLRESFDESVLIWHIATDLCFRRSHRRRQGAAAAKTGELEQCTRAISNYMAHLLNYRPDMLMTGSRRHLLTEALEDLEAIILRPELDDEALLEAIHKAGKSERHAYPLIHDACKLSDELMAVQPEETRWELMYRAWIGMLCYSATMCRGYLHAKSLGEGGEFLSFVWLVLSLKGTKTLADKLQMPEPDVEDGGAPQPRREVPAAARPPTTEDLESLVD